MLVFFAFLLMCFFTCPILLEYPCRLNSAIPTTFPPLPTSSAITAPRRPSENTLAQLYLVIFGYLFFFNYIILPNKVLFCSIDISSNKDDHFWMESTIFVPFWNCTCANSVDFCWLIISSPSKMTENFSFT